MLARYMRRGARPSGRDLQLLFTLTVVLPGLLLGIVGVRAWLLDRRLADQQLRERVDRAADLALRAFEQDMREWQTLLETTERDGVPVDGASGRLRAAFAEPGAGALVLRGPDGPALWPATQAPYLLPATAVAVSPPPVTPLVQAAEQAETRDRDYAQAITLYERALRTLPPGERAATLHRLARTQRKAGRPDAAIAIYRELSSSTGQIGPLPADLVARHELCVLLSRLDSSGEDVRLALGLYNDLVSGRWRLEQTRYLFYSASIQRMLGDVILQTEGAQWSDIERRKLALAEAASNTGETTSTSRIDAGGTVVAFRTAAAPNITLLLSRAWLAGSLWPRTFETAGASGFHTLVQGPDGDTWFSTTQGAGPPALATSAITRQPDVPGVSWRLRVAPRDPATLMADVRRWRTLNLVMLLSVVALLAFGTYLTTRVVRRELEVARLQSDFVAAVSHEFRSPLTGIRQLGEMLLRGRVPDETRRQEYYERITRESDRLSRLVENLLDVAQIEAGRKEYRFARVDTSGWLRGVVDEARTNPAHRQPTIEARIPESLPALTGDKDALSSVVHNLLDNAVKYSPGTEAVWCEAEAHDGQVTIRVRDRGVGMSDDDRRIVFERFRRGHGSITEQVKGTGLGLSLVEHIVKAHGGRIECDTRLGEGTTFSIHLAAAAADTGV